jgi:hypothetical protein
LTRRRTMTDVGKPTRYYLTQTTSPMTQSTPPMDFRRRFRMNNEVFMKTVFGVREYDAYFMCKKYCTGLWGFSSVQKCTTAIYVMSYIRRSPRCSR